MQQRKFSRHGLPRVHSNVALLSAVGRNTLTLMGLNGAFFHFFNPKLVAIMPPHDDPMSVALFAFAVAAISLVACAPMVHLRNKYVPQLIGRSAMSGPWLPSFEGYLHQVKH